MNHTEELPEYGRIPIACRIFGLSRSRLYILAGEGHVRFIKVGSATLRYYVAGATNGGFPPFFVYWPITYRDCTGLGARYLLAGGVP